MFGLHADPGMSSLSDKYPERLFVILGNVSSNTDRSKAVDTCRRYMGGIDTLVYCAGVIDPIQRIDTVDIKAVKWIYDINVFGAMTISQLCLPYLRKSAQRNPTNAACGKAIIFSSACDLTITYMGWMPYCTSKAALTRFIQVLAHEEPTLSVQGVYPKLTKTSMSADVIDGKYKGVMADHEVERFRVWNEVGHLFVEPPAWCGEAVAKLALGKFVGGKSGEVLYYDEHVPDYRAKL